ncbi:MAG: hypothetical protein JXA44_11340 [Methanospirillaceae archaeon]|nr:hypothetical protein [Methanospirillaceae archaeon]
MNQTQMKRLKPIVFCLLVLGMSIAMVPASATIFIEDGSEIEDGALYELIADVAPEYSEDAVVFFYDPECGVCTPAHEFLDEYIKINPETHVQILNLADSSEERKLFKEFKQQFNREVVYTPVLYIGPVAFEGSPDIKEYFEEVYLWYTSEKNL